MLEKPRLIRDIELDRNEEKSNSAYELEALQEANEALRTEKKITKDWAEHLKEKLENCPSYRAYDERPINLDTLETVLDDFEKSIDKEDPAAIKELNNARSLLRNVYEGIDSYNEAIAKQALVNIGYNENDNYFRRDYQAEHEAMDRHRRLVHNGLISSLTALNRHFAREFPKYGFEVDKNNLFGQRHIEDRHYIGEWAISMAKAQPIRTTLKELKQLKIKNGRSASR